MPPLIKKIPTPPNAVGGVKNEFKNDKIGKVEQKHYSLPGDKDDYFKRVASGAELSDRISKKTKARGTIERGPTVVKGFKKLWINLK